MTEEQKIRIGSTALVVIGFVSIFIYFSVNMVNDMVQTQLKSDEKFFNAQGSLFCKGSPFHIGTDYLVSKENGWEIYKDAYFKKEDLLIDRKNCVRDESGKQ